MGSLHNSNPILSVEPTSSSQQGGQHRSLGPTKGVDGASLKQIRKLKQRKDTAGKGPFNYPGLKNSTISKEEGIKKFLPGSEMRGINEGNGCQANHRACDRMFGGELVWVYNKRRRRIPVLLLRATGL